MGRTKGSISLATIVVASAAWGGSGPPEHVQPSGDVPFEDGTAGTVRRADGEESARDALLLTDGSIRGSADARRVTSLLAAQPKPERDGATSVAGAVVPWRTSPYAIRTLLPETRFELRDGRVTTAWPPTRIHDRFGVPMRIIGGERRYHPLGLVRLGLKYLSRYRRSGDALFLDRAKRIAAGLQRIAVRTENAIWFPYRFRFAGNQPPWYSGYAQGFALSFFVRLWEATTTVRYRVLADLTYNSLRTLRRASGPWVTWVDGSRYVWIDEYPQELDRTFNGHVFALFGLHDYLEMTKRRDLYSSARHSGVLALLRGGITTMRAYASTFRNPGAVSDYCLAHHVRNPSYHPVHVMQLRFLTVMTGDAWFERMADHFAADVA